MEAAWADEDTPRPSRQDRQARLVSTLPPDQVGFVVGSAVEPVAAEGLAVEAAEEGSATDLAGLDPVETGSAIEEAPVDAVGSVGRRTALVTAVPARRRPRTLHPDPAAAIGAAAVVLPTDLAQTVGTTTLEADAHTRTTDSAVEGPHHLETGAGASAAAATASPFVLEAKLVVGIATETEIVTETETEIVIVIVIDPATADTAAAVVEEGMKTHFPCPTKAAVPPTPLSPVGPLRLALLLPQLPAENDTTTTETGIILAIATETGTETEIGIATGTSEIVREAATEKLPEVGTTSRGRGGGIEEPLSHLLFAMVRSLWKLFTYIPRSLFFLSSLLSNFFLLFFTVLLTLVFLYQFHIPLFLTPSP